MEHPYARYLELFDWRRPLDRNRTPNENRAAIAKVDQLVAEARARGEKLTKERACCKVDLNYNGTYYKLKREDNLSPTEANMVKLIRAANNPGGPGRPRKRKKCTDAINKVVAVDTTDMACPIVRIQEDLQVIQDKLAGLRDVGVFLRLTTVTN